MLDNFSYVENSKFLHYSLLLSPPKIIDFLYLVVKHR